MRGLNTGIQHLSHLPREFVVNLDPAERDCLDQPRNRGWIALTADQNEMNADVEFGILTRQRDRVLESGAGSHQGRGSQNALAAGMHNALVNVARKAEVVGVDNEVLQNIESLTCRNFFGLDRKSRISRFISRVAPLRLSYNCWLTRSW